MSEEIEPVRKYDKAATDWLLEVEREKTRRDDQKYAAFEAHQRTCKQCRRTFEFWCDEGLALFRSSK